VLALTNETPVNLPEVQLVVHVPGHFSVARLPRTKRPELPEPPRTYGPRQVNRFDLSMPPMAVMQALQVGKGVLPGVQIDNTGSATLRFQAVHLRPHARVILTPVVLLLPNEGPVTATWEATSTGVDGRLEGDIELPVGGGPLEVGEALRLSPAER